MNELPYLLGAALAGTVETMPDGTTYVWTYTAPMMRPPYSEEAPMTDTITLPRRVVKALVDPDTRPYMALWYDEFQCSLCREEQTGLWTDTEDGVNHDADCPVRLAQEALAAAAKGTET